MHIFMKNTFLFCFSLFLSLSLSLSLSVSLLVQDKNIFQDYAQEIMIMQKNVRQDISITRMNVSDSYSTNLENNVKYLDNQNYENW